MNRRVVEDYTVNRRDFMRTGGVVWAGALLSGSEMLEAAARRPANWRTFEVTTRVEVLGTSGPVRVWLPAALITSTPFQKTLANKFECEGGSAKMIERKADSMGILAAEFPAGVESVLTLTSRVATRDWSVDVAAPEAAPKTSSSDLHYFLRSTKLLPTSGIVRETADQITKNSRTDVDKARAIYEWIVENTYREPKTRGCGVGDIRFMLESRDLGGKCADLNALYVGLARAAGLPARAAGLPARDVYGIRTAKSELGYKSLGASSDHVTKAQHCRAEVYLNGHGWVAVDPADVRKVMLEEPPGNGPLDDPMVKSARARLFGSWEMNWMAGI